MAKEGNVAAPVDSQRFVADPTVVAEAVLEPVLRFLKHSGVTEAEAQQALKNAWKRSQAKPKKGVALGSLEDPQPYVDLVTTWSRSADYLDSSGLPRDLPVNGRTGFNALLKRVAPNLKARAAIDVLAAYGNVQVLRNGRLRLARPFFHIRTDRKLAFEPSVRFLVDAARNVRSSLVLNEVPQRQAATHFWRSVEHKRLSRKKLSAFLAFAKTQSLGFLQDLDDWLSENGDTKKSGGIRVGLGLFSFGSSDSRR